MLQMPALPCSGEFISAIRQSSRSLRQAAQILIDSESIKRLLLSPTFTLSYKRVSASHGLAFPLKFSSVLDELNLISILSLLNFSFSSEYRLPLRAKTGRDAWDSIRALVLSLYLVSSTEGDDLLSARGMQCIHEAKIAESMGVNVHVERPHDTIPGLTIGELGGPLYQLVKLITRVLNKTGDILINMGYANLGSFVVEALNEAAKTRSIPSVNAELEVVLERLVRAIPAFQDMAEVDGQPIYLYKKALFLIHAIAIRFGSISPPPFPIPSTSQIPVFTDDVLPSMLVHLGVIDLSVSPSLSSIFPSAGSKDKLTTLLQACEQQKTASEIAIKEGPVVTLDQAYILRAAALDACELIVEVARSLFSSSVSNDGASLDWIKEISLPDLDLWIRTAAENREDYRALERFVLRDTTFF